MADYKGGEIFIDLGGIDIEITSTATTNTSTVDGIYSRLETAFNLGKRIVITNYVSQYGGGNPIQKCVPTSVALYNPSGTRFFIPVLGYSGITMITISSSNIVSVYKVYVYHNIYTPPETTNNARILEETETEKGEESK